jgi:hypothetical protein
MNEHSMKMMIHHQAWEPISDKLPNGMFFWQRLSRENIAANLAGHCHSCWVIIGYCWLYKINV